MWNWKITAILALFVISLDQIDGQGEQCYAPSNNIGICVVLPQCPSLVNFYAQNQRNPQAINYLLQAQRNCGTRRIRENPIVCCDSPTINQATTTVSPIRPRPEEVPEEIPERVPVNPVTEPTRINTTPAPKPTTSSRAVSSTCNDPNGISGVCMNIKECPSILNEFVAKSKDPNYVQYIQRSNAKCGNVQPYICCPDASRTDESGVNVPIDQSQIQGRFLTIEEGCGFSNATHKRIVGGNKAKEGAWPWMALLGYVNNLGEQSWKCGGSLITTRHVLSAAHCITSTLSFARLGEHDVSSTSDGTTEDIKITRSVKHPEYDKRDGTSDLSILYLERDATLSLRIKPICMPTEEPLRSRAFTGYQPFVAGWGRLQEGGKSSNVLQELQLPVLSNDVCRDRYQKQGKLISQKQFGEKVVCAGILTGGKDSCQGDSGGPLMQPINYNEESRFYQIGVVSYGIGCARTDVPGVYTSVQHFVDWIRDRVNE